MLLRPGSCNYDDILTDAAVHILREHGLRGLSIRAVADWMRITPAAVSHHVNRDQLMVLVSGRFGARWLGWILQRTFTDGVLALLPPDEDEIYGVRVWLALAELGRNHLEVGEQLRDVRREERDILHRVTQGRLDSAAADTTLALVDGLRALLCPPAACLAGDRLSLTEARASLDAHVTRHLASEESLAIL